MRDSLKQVGDFAIQIRFLTLVFMFFTLIFGDNFLLLILANCVRDGSCREKSAPISPNGSIIKDAAVSPTHRCTL